MNPSIFSHFAFPMVAAGFSLRLQTVVSFSLRNLKVAATLPHFLDSPFSSSLTKPGPALSWCNKLKRDQTGIIV